eukprot:14674-Heterococcus_DN1.PRE.2
MALTVIEEGKKLPETHDTAARRKALELRLAQLNENATDCINSPPYLRRSAKEAVYLTETVRSGALAAARQLIDLPASSEFKGGRHVTDTILQVLELLLAVATAKGYAQQETFSFELQTVFAAATASQCLICCALLQRVLVYKVLHSSSPLKLDWRALLSKGGALHHGSAIPLAAMLMYITAVVKAAGDSHKQTAQWLFLNAMCTLDGK